MRSPGAAASRGSEGAARRHASHLHRGDNAEARREGSAETAGRSSSGVRGQGRGDPRPEPVASAPRDSGETRAPRGGRAGPARSSCRGRAPIDSAARPAPGGLRKSRSRPPLGAPGRPRPHRRRPARPVSAAPQVAAGRAAGRRSLRLRPRGLRQPPRPEPGRAFSCPRPAGDGRGLSPLPAAAARGPRFEPQGLRSRVLGGVGTRAGRRRRRRSGGALASLSPGPRGGRGGTRRGFSCAACLARPARPAASWELEGRGRAWLRPRPACWSWAGAVWDAEPG